MTTLHAHIDRSATDCDGTCTSDYVMVFNDAEKASEFGDIEFHDRVVASLVNTYSIMAEGSLRVIRLGDGDVRIIWSEATEEGGVHSEATFCNDDCDLGERSQRDHSAEAMGY